MCRQSSPENRFAPGIPFNILAILRFGESHDHISQPLSPPGPKLVRMRVSSTLRTCTDIRSTSQSVTSARNVTPLLRLSLQVFRVNMIPPAAPFRKCISPQSVLSGVSQGLLRDAAPHDALDLISSWLPSRTCLPSTLGGAAPSSTRFPSRPARQARGQGQIRVHCPNPGGAARIRVLSSPRGGDADQRTAVCEVADHAT